MGWEEGASTPSSQHANLDRRSDMQRDSTAPPFLGPCEVCGKHSRNYTAFSQHLRFKVDSAHQDLKVRWHVWRSEYRATLRCRKCGGLFEITDKALKDSKRCPRCEHLRQAMSKRQYEKVTFNKKPDPRRVNGDGGSKASWPVGYVPEVEWEVDGPLYREVLSDLMNPDRFSEGVGVRETLVQQGIPYAVYKAIGEHALGKKGYAKLQHDRMVEKMRVIREKARTDSKLEQDFVDQLHGVGIEPCSRNCWTTVAVDGKRVRREADIKVAVGDGRKIIVLCDGEAFHGPKCMYADPKEKIAGDRATALAFYAMGYTVLRYSEGEILDGSALAHFRGVLCSLSSWSRVYRNWHPREEMQRGGKGGS
jgi:phage FluMu protein Com